MATQNPTDANRSNALTRKPHARAAFPATEPCFYQNQTTGFNPLYELPKPQFGSQNQPDPQPNEPNSRGYPQQQYPLQRLLRSCQNCYTVRPVMAISKDLLEILVCPLCKATVELKPDQSGLKCVECKRVYPIRDDIPVMLIDEATIEE